jgi:hypothetical protein
LWIIYIALLIVLLPHTAWAFAKFEPTGSEWVSWAAAFAFEAAIAALTHKLTGVIEETARIRKTWKRLAAQYLNVYAIGLYVAVGVSALANFAHAVEFGRGFAIFDTYSIPNLVYSLAFGGILPFCSLLFARILANVRYTELDRDEELETAKANERAAKKEAAELRQRLSITEQELIEVRQQLSATEQEFVQSKQRLVVTEQKFTEVRQQAKAAEALFAESLQERIWAVKQHWPDLKNSAIAILTESSPSYVSETLNNNGYHRFNEENEP